MTKGYNAGAQFTKRVASAALVSKRNDGACIKVAPTSTQGPALICKDIKEWLQPKGKAYRALLVRRPQNSPELQEHVDKVANSLTFGIEQSIQEDVNLPCFARDLSKKSKSLASLAVKNGLPKDFEHRVQQDFEQIAEVLVQLTPSAKKLSFKLDIMGENSCSRWHQDHYIGRAVITYNSCGTEYIGHDNVNFKHLGHGGGMCSEIVRDKSRIFAADVGDILLMKGKLFPGAVNGLVHRSPPMRWHADERVVNRLLLKVDVN